MIQIRKTTSIQAPIHSVWRVIDDIGSIADWHPGVAQSPVLSEHASGMGAARRIELYDGSTAVETVTRYEKGRSLTVIMSEHSMPLSFGAATFSVEDKGQDQTEVTMTMDYKMKYGPIGWLLNTLMLEGIMHKLLTSVLAGLGHHIQTGEIIPQNWSPEGA